MIHMYNLLRPNVQSNSIEYISDGLQKVGQDFGPNMQQTTKDVVALFARSLQLFAQCHNIYNKKLITEEDISTLGMLSINKGMYHTKIYL